MQRGLEGRRIAVVVPSAAQAQGTAAIKALEGAGAQLHVLKPGEGSEEDWHGSRYAALVLVGDGDAALNAEPSLVQLAREFLVSEKPVAAFGAAVGVLLESGGAAGRTVAAPGDGSLKEALETSGASCVDEPIHADEGLVTASKSANIDEFAARVVREFATRLEEREVDEMSDMSFPASDPPAVTPTSIGRASPDSDARQ